MLDQPKSVEILSDGRTWVVRVREYGDVIDRHFDRQEHAESFAAGQAFRLGLDLDVAKLPS